MRRSLLGLLGPALLTGCPQAPEPTPASTDRVVSQTVDSDEILWALGPAVRSSVVGISIMADDARYSTIAGSWPPEVPRVKGSTEALLALQPSLVFLAEWSDPHARALVENAGIGVEVLHGFGGFDDYRTRVRTIATRVNAEAQGAQVVDAFDQKLALASDTPLVPPTIVSFSSGNVAAAGTTFADEAQAAGFVNIPSREGLQGHRAVGLDQLVAWQPQFIAIACEEDCAATERAFAARAGIEATPAADGGIIAIEPRLLFATGAAMTEVVEILKDRRVATR